jgi:tetratricopeptide (TPR) repeat protein
MNLDKLKEAARKYEQGSQWRQAIDVYKKALREFEESGEGVPDPSLYNRIGDLEMKDNDSGAAVRAYEQASDLYTEQGFFNNAIALCGKILRINPGRTSTYLRLAQLHARKNFVGEARKNLLEYMERMDALNHHAEAVAAVRAFADQFSGNPDMRLMLVDLVRDTTHGESTREQLEEVARELEGLAEPEGPALTGEHPAAIDGDPAAGRSSALGGDLVFLDVGIPGQPAGGLGAGVVEGFDLGREAEPHQGWRRDPETIDGLEFVGTSDPDDADTAIPGDLLTDSPFEAGDGGAVVGDPDPIDIDAFPRVERRTAAAEPAADSPDDAYVVDPGTDLPAVESGPVTGDATGLVFLPVDAAGRIAEDDPAVLARDRARVLLEIGDRAGGIAALEEAVRHFDTSGRLIEAIQAADELIRLEPDAIYRHQSRVELAYRSGDRLLLLQAYLGLGEALVASGGADHAVSVYRRVLEHDPDNPKARSALASLGRPETPPAPPPSAFVDLGSLILDEPQVRDTRMRIGQENPIEDEDRAFLDALEQFKRGIDANLDSEDFQAHYDLGIAFKEMGLLDEAIAQFQKALRSPEGRLKTSEQLGIAFFEKARFAIAEAVLRRATESLPGGDEDKIGLIYWLGRALEAQQRREEALRCYERALAVDIRFLDVGDRVHRLGTVTG